VNEDRVNDREPGALPGPGDSAQAAANAGPQPTVVDANGPCTAGPSTAGPSAANARRKLGQSFTTRAVGIAGVAALVVVGSIVGSAVLSSAGSSPRSANIRTVLTASHDASATSPATITVTGSGEVEGTPDTATFDIGVSTTAHTAVEALEENNAQVATLEQSLEQSGVQLKDMQTSWLNLSANTNSRGKVKNFTADDELTVTMNNLSNLGAALDAAVTATGNGVTLDGISFSISNQSALLGAARAQAMQAANTEATQVAAGGGLTLGPIVSITDQENAGQYVYYSQLNTAAPVAGTAVPVQPGQQQISVQVTVVYQLVASS
jgi:uncharacterized protein YggE